MDKRLAVLKMRMLAGAAVLGIGATVALAPMAANAAFIDFTADNATSGTVLPGTQWDVTPNDGMVLTDATHWNNVGCADKGWDFTCVSAGNRYDVGFGVNRNGVTINNQSFFDNQNEIDGKLGVSGSDEFVHVRFNTVVKLLGFAGMLTYDKVPPPNVGSREQVRLDYRVNGGAWQSEYAEALFPVKNSQASVRNFDTVGLAFKNGLSIFADEVRFMAWGTDTADDGSFNVTAAGLEVSAVPLPAAGYLLLGGLGSLAALRRRRKAA